MGQQHLYVQSAGLNSAADGFDSTAQSIEAAARIRLGGLAFDGGLAGRDYIHAGEALRRALDGWTPELARWSRAGSEIVAALRAGLTRYRRAEHFAADRLG